MNSTALLGSYFTAEAEPDELPPYVTLGARPQTAGVVSMDSSDQSVVLFDQVTGVAACRTGINFVGPNQEVIKREIGEIRYLTAHPTAPNEEQLRLKLALEQSLRLSTGRRYSYASLRSRPPMLPPRLIAAGLRVAEDYRTLQVFANSAFAMPGMLYMGDGRLNAQNYPGAAAIDLQGRLLRARGVRSVALTKDGMLISVVRSTAKAIRRRVGDRPFAFAITPDHLRSAYRARQGSSSPKTIRHGSSTSALGGIGAVRFGLSLCGNNLVIVEMSLYDFEVFSWLVQAGEQLESYVARLKGVRPDGRGDFPAVYSWDILPFVTERDWDVHILPTLEEIVWSACTDTELSIYPRGLSDVHNHVKLRVDDPEIEHARREIIISLVRQKVPFEMIQIEPEGPHKTDPEEFDGHGW